MPAIEQASHMNSWNGKLTGLSFLQKQLLSFSTMPSNLIKISDSMQNCEMQANSFWYPYLIGQEIEQSIHPSPGRE